MIAIGAYIYSTFILGGVPVLDTYMLQGAYSTRWAMVIKGWFRASPGVILLSWSSVSIRFSRSMNSFLSTFSAINSLPSKSVGTLICQSNIHRRFETNVYI